MMTGYPKLKGLLVEKGIKQKYLADKLDISTTTFNNKINGVGDFSVSEARKICLELNISPNIFFTDFVPNMERMKKS